MDLLDLIERDTRLKRVASTRGGEWQGPCPWCGGVDRFWVHPYHDPPEYQCRHCGRKGDDIGYLRDHDGMTFLQACAYLGLDPKDPRGHQDQDNQLGSVPVPRLHAEAPNSVWQARATLWCRQAVACLWGEQGAPARDYLQRRGLSESSLKSALLGWHPSSRHESARLWGLSGSAVYLPAGMVIPCLSGGDLWRVNVRRFGQEPPYVLVRGSTSLLYRVETLTAGRPALLVESELDAVLVAEEAGDLATALATGSVTGARQLHWQLELAIAPLVLVAFDADEPGDHAAQWWLESLPHARRWRPLVKDPGEMRSAGLSVREWVEDGIRTWQPKRLGTTKPAEPFVPVKQAGDAPPDTPSPAPSSPLEEWKGSVPPEPCALCGQEAFLATLLGTPICPACWDQAYPGGMAETCRCCRRTVEHYDPTGRAWCLDCWERGGPPPCSVPPLPSSAPKTSHMPLPQSIADLLLSLPPSWRHQLLVRRAARAYHQAGRPAVRYRLYSGASPEMHQGRQLFEHLGWALEAPLGPHPAALELLQQLATDGGVCLGPDRKEKKAG